MDKLGQLITELQSFKENLNKNVNQSYTQEPNAMGGDANMAKDARDPKLAPKDVKVKQLQAQIDAGTYKPDPAKIADKLIQKNPKLNKQEKLTFNKCGQWSIEKEEKVNLNNPYNEQLKGQASKDQRNDKNEKEPELESPKKGMKHRDQPSISKDEGRCWDGYEPTPGKKPYEKGSCQPVKKEEIEVAPKGSNNRETYLQSFGKSKDIYGEELDSHMMMRDLVAMKKRIEEIIETLDPKKIAPDWMKSKITEASSHVCAVADSLVGLEKSLDNDEIEVVEWDNGDIDVIVGQDVSEDDFNFLCKSLCEKADCEEMDKKEWSPKAEHKSDKGGLTASGRESYNKATGGNLKAPQPGGGPRKRSFCARNKGQIDKHNIDCKKTPEKRACKARRRWKCKN